MKTFEFFVCRDGEHATCRVTATDEERAKDIFTSRGYENWDDFECDQDLVLITEIDTAAECIRDAAPDLLEALEVISRTMLEDGLDKTPELEWEFEIISMAIAKAKGTQP